MRNSSVLFILATVISCTSPKNSSDSVIAKSPFKTVGSVERLDPELSTFIPEDAKIEVLASGFEWAEGPLWLADQNALIFTDVPTNKIWKWTEEDSLSLFLEPSGYLGTETNKKEPGANGLALNANGDLILCQHGERQIAKMNASLSAPKADFTALVSDFEGKKFNSPNDLVINKSGQIFFTDPPYGLDDWNPKELDFQGVYRLDADGSLHLLLDTLNRPNGIGLSPDQNTLYIAQSDAQKARYYAFDLDEKGDILNGKVLLDATSSVGDKHPGLPDGLTVHSSGTLFVTGPGGVWVISPEGKHLGTIGTGQGTANCAFDANEDYLYMTADAYLMRIKVN
ncbi:SMP-30/gluconolactonase/LRE family protein [Algoriphagus sp. D3-2-R+10]|uniref:SMP-30/gluconolactonase/LRE family protein n=1 Tax=Algoriphagus aurantiacus TaxID=3103948 RepID=UPI002B3AC850|nr:SMP-30/gluconolactonase/LRE family protein [Algoriphagus sp. D3-2-R+10]MEB2775022.1 SMP-30/gluconolactonase/LRE family protein [Algoriphagus sp. D3-2-R+10]